MTRLIPVESNSTDHPNDEQLISYLAGKLPESTHDSVQAHLVDCDNCLERFKDIQDFFESPRENEELITEDRLHIWTVLWKRIREENRREPEPSIAVVARSPWGSKAGWAMAAMLLVILALGVWAIRQRDQNQRLAAGLEVARRQSVQLQANHDNLAARVKGLEQENSALQERGLPVDKSRSRRDADVKKPELNAPIYDLYARNFAQRSGNQSEVNRIKVPSTPESIILILNGEGLTGSPSYKVEIVNEAERVLWRAAGLKRSQMGNFTVTLDKSFLSKGTYRLRLYGQEGWSSKPLTEYVLRIE